MALTANQRMRTNETGCERERVRVVGEEKVQAKHPWGAPDGRDLYAWYVQGKMAGFFGNQPKPRSQGSVINKVGVRPSRVPVMNVSLKLHVVGSRTT